MSEKLGFKKGALLAPMVAITAVSAWNGIADARTIEVVSSAVESAEVVVPPAIKSVDMFDNQVFMRLAASVATEGTASHGWMFVTPPVLGTDVRVPFPPILATAKSIYNFQLSQANREGKSVDQSKVDTIKSQVGFDGSVVEEYRADAKLAKDRVAADVQEPTRLTYKIKGENIIITPEASSSPNAKSGSFNTTFEMTPNIIPEAAFNLVANTWVREDGKTEDYSHGIKRASEESAYIKALDAASISCAEFVLDSESPMYDFAVRAVKKIAAGNYNNTHEDQITEDDVTVVFSDMTSLRKTNPWSVELQKNLTNYEKKSKDIKDSTLSFSSKVVEQSKCTVAEDVKR